MRKGNTGVRVTGIAALCVTQHHDATIGPPPTSKVTDTSELTRKIINIVYSNDCTHGNCSAVTVKHDC